MDNKKAEKELIQTHNFESLASSMAKLIEKAQHRVASTINQELVRLYWELGRHIVEFEQHGFDRAQYGEALLPQLAERLKPYGKGFSRRNLNDFRRFYGRFPIWQAVPAKCAPGMAFR